MLRDQNVPDKEFSKAERETLYKLIYSLYQADLNFINVVSRISDESAYKDTKKMHDAARKIQFWVRTKLSKGIEIPNDLDKSESVGAVLSK
jgi:hypothetical protein